MDIKETMTSKRKFSKGQFVKLVKQNAIVEIDKFDERDEVYFVNYVSVDLEKEKVKYGGSSGWWPESDFELITDARTILMLELYRLEKESQFFQRELDKVTEVRKHLTFALAIIKNNGRTYQ